MNEFEQAPHVITVLVVDDHPLLRDGIASALENEPDMRLVAEAVDGKSALLNLVIQYAKVPLHPDRTLDHKGQKENIV